MVHPSGSEEMRDPFHEGFTDVFETLFQSSDRASYLFGVALACVMVGLILFSVIVGLVSIFFFIRQEIEDHREIP